MTQTELANELRISQSCLSKIESDRLEPSASHLLWLLNRLLGVNALAELDVVLVPARLQIEQKDLQRDHAKKLHRGKFIEKCGACVGEKTAKLLIAQNSSDLQAGLSSQLGKTLRPATA
jgi:transcriptional regulator with XRE-family HTH domain